MKNEIKLSDYQKAVADWFEAERNKRKQTCGIVKSAAGSGKTFMISHLCSMLEYMEKSRVVYLAFNNEIVAEMVEKQNDGKLPDFVDIRTNHSLGLANINMVRYFAKQPRAKVDNKKRWDLIKLLKVKTANGIDWSPADFSSVIEKLVSLAKGQGWVNPNGRGKGLGYATDKNLAHLKYHHVITFPEITISENPKKTANIPDGIVFSWVREVLESSLSTNTVSFDDMIWLPVALGHFTKKKFYIFVDESQDSTPCMRALVKMHLHRNGTATFVGDENQSINGWCGADSEAMNRIQTEFDARVLPMSVTYRNSLAMVRHLKQYVPNLEAAPDAIEGRVDHIDSVDFQALNPDETLFICRYTAPLIKACLQLMAQRIPAHVRGRDLASGLNALIDNLTKRKSLDTNTFKALLSDWHAKEAKKAENESDESALESANDRLEGLRAIADTCDNTAEMKRAITRMFEQGNGFCFTSGHRSKGLECKTAIILTTGENKRAVREWQKKQEMYVSYVMESRATHELLFIDPEDFDTCAEFAG